MSPGLERWVLAPGTRCPQSWWGRQLERWLSERGRKGGWGVRWGRSWSSEGLSRICPQPAVIPGFGAGPTPPGALRTPPDFCHWVVCLLCPALSSLLLPNLPLCHPWPSCELTRSLQHLLYSWTAFPCQNCHSMSPPLPSAPLHPLWQWPTCCRGGSCPGGAMEAGVCSPSC